MKNITWSGRVILTLALVAAGSGLLLWAQDPQPVGTFQPMAFGDVRSHAATTVLADGRTVIAGGFDADGNPTTTILAYNPADGLTGAIGELPAARVGHTATALEDGRVLIAGGLVEGLPTAETLVFNPADQTFTSGALVIARSGHAATRLEDGTVLLVGGTDGSVALANAEVFDAETSTSSETSPMFTPRAGASATKLIDHRVLVAGGVNETGDLATAEVFHPLAGAWEPATTTLSVARSGHAAVLLPHNNAVLIAGGSSGGVAVNAADLFLPAEFPDPYSYGMGTFATTSPNVLSVPRVGAYGGPFGDNGLAFVAGGAEGADRYRFATIKTDTDDYAPGDRAIITGSGWVPGEQVTLLFQEDPPVHDDYVLTVDADGNGDIYYDQWAPEEHDLNVRFYLMAFGSQSRAQMTFTDSNNFNVTPLSQTVASGSTNTFVWTFAAQNSGNQQTTTFMIPVGWTAPQTAAGPGQVTVAAGAVNPCNVSLQSISAQTVTIRQSPPAPTTGTCGNNTTFTLTYASATAPTVASSTNYTFVNQHGQDPVVTAVPKRVTSVTVGAQTGALTYGTGGSATYAVDVQRNGTGNTTVNLSLPTSLPAGATFSFTPATLNFTGSQTLLSSTLTINTAGTTPAGSLSFTVQGTNTAVPGDFATGNGTLTINQAPVTATAGSGSATYDGLAKTPSACVVSGTFTGDLTCANDPASVGPDADSYTIDPVVSGTGLSNFAITPVSGTYTIDPAPATVTAGSGSGIYNGHTQTPSTCAVSGPGFLGDLTCTNDPASVGPDAGTFVITPVAASANLANFAITPVAGSYTIDPAPATVTAGSGSGIYNGHTQTPSACAVSGPGFLGDLTCTNDPASVGPDAGTFVITPVPASANLANFAITPVAGSYTIDPAPATVTAGSGSGIYNGHTQAPSACTVTGPFTGDLTCSNDPTSVGPDAGTFVITPVPASANLANFAITPVAGSYTIDPAPATVTAGSGSGTYNGAPQTPSACAVSGPGFLGDLTCTNDPASVGPDAGTFVITPVPASANLANFAITPVAGSYTIDPAPVTATAGGGGATYNGDPKVPSACVVTGAYTGNLTCTNNPPTVGPTAGPYPIVPVVTGPDSANFLVTPVNGLFTIAKAETTTTISCPATVLYNGTPLEPCTATVTGPAGLKESVPVAYANNVNPGTASATATYAETTNYFGSSAATTFEIVQKTYVLAIDNESIAKGIAPNNFSSSHVNEANKRIGQRTPLPRFSGSYVGSELTLYTGQTGDEGWFALQTIPASWVGAGPTEDGLRNFVGRPSLPAPHAVGLGLGAGSDPEKLLDKIPNVTPLRATGLFLLEGTTVCAIVWDSDISMNYSPLEGSLKGSNLGTVAFEVLSVSARTDSGRSTSSLPQVRIRVLDAAEVCERPLNLPPAPIATYTQAGWDRANPPVLNDSTFADAYPGGSVVIGGPVHTVSFTSAAAIKVFLSAGGKANKPLTDSRVDPLNTPAGVLAGNVLALTLNVDFSAAGVTTPGLGALKLKSGALAGKTVAQVLAAAQLALSNGTLPAGVTSLAALDSILAKLNQNFVDGVEDQGYLTPW